MQAAFACDKEGQKICVHFPYTFFCDVSKGELNRAGAELVEWAKKIETLIPWWQCAKFCEMNEPEQNVTRRAFDLFCYFC